MRNVLSDIWDITVSLLQTAAVFSYVRIAAMSRKRRTALYIFLFLLTLCIIRLINWGNVGGEAALLTVAWVYLYVTKPKEGGVIDEDM